MAKRETYHHGDLKEALIRAGLQIIEESGLSGLSLRTCAERTGVSHTAPKNHFGNVAGLFTAIAARGYAQMAARMQQDQPQGATRVQRRDAALAGYVAFARANPALFELMHSRQRTNSADPALQAAVGECFAILRDAAEGLIWDKSDAPDAELRAQMMLWSFVHGFAQLTVSGKFDKPAMNGLGILEIMPGFNYAE